MNPDHYSIGKREAEHKCRERVGVNISAYQIGPCKAHWAIHGDHSTISDVIFCPFCGDRLPRKLEEIG